MSDIFEIKTSVGTMLVQAKTGSVAVGYARRALPADAVIHDADAEETTEGSGDGGTSTPQDPPAGDEGDGGQTHDPET